MSLRAKNLNIQDKEGYTIMMRYLLKKKIGMVKKILIRGADINFRNIFGKTALHYAIEESLDESIIRFLIGRGANPHLEDIMGWDCCSKGKTKYPTIKEFKNCSTELRVPCEKPQPDLKIVLEESSN